MPIRRALIGLVIAGAMAGPALVLTGGLDAGSALAQTQPPVFLVKGVAVGGYDPVAYFTEHKPVKGNPAISLEHEGAKYFFASEESREAFKKDPDKYLPQYGGYCAWAVSHGSTASADPNAWTIQDGKLFLNYDKGVKVSWDKNVSRNIAKADANWPKVVGIKKTAARPSPASVPKEPVVETEPAKAMEPAKMSEPAKMTEPEKMAEPSKMMDAPKMMDAAKSDEPAKAMEPAASKSDTREKAAAPAADAPPPQMDAPAKEAAKN